MMDSKGGHLNKVVLALMKFTSVSEQTFSALLNRCSIDEQQSVLKYKHRKDQVRSLLAIFLIKYSFTTYLDSKVERTIKKDPNGKPLAIDWLGDISISHSENWILTGISTAGRLGVDIECLYPFPFIGGTEELFLSEKELAFYQTQRVEESQKYMVTMWTLKEAYFKEIGKGLTLINPTSLSFNYHPKIHGNCFKYKGKNGDSHLLTYDIEGTAIASVSINKNSSDIHIHMPNQKQVLSGFSPL